MMNKTLLILSLFLFAQSNSQLYSNDTETKTGYKFSYGYQQTLVSFNNANMLAFNFEFFLSNNISFNYNISYNFSKDKTFFHTTLGLVGGLSLLSSTLKSSYSTYDYLITLLIFVPEGINFYLPINDMMCMVPYIYPLGYDYVIDDYSMTSSVGMKFEIMPIKNISLNPFADIKIFYKLSKSHFGFDIGLLLGIDF